MNKTLPRRGVARDSLPRKFHCETGGVYTGETNVAGLVVEFPGEDETCDAIIPFERG